MGLRGIEEMVKMKKWGCYGGAESCHLPRFKLSSD